MRNVALTLALGFLSLAVVIGIFLRGIAGYRALIFAEVGVLFAVVGAAGLLALWFSRNSGWSVLPVLSRLAALCLLLVGAILAKEFFAPRV